MAVRKTRITTTEIARRLGLSQSTVSHILNGTSGMRFSPETVMRVKQYAREAGYLRGVLRKAVKQPLKQIGFFVSNIFPLDSSFLAEVFSGVLEATTTAGYTLTVCKAGGNGYSDPASMEDHADRLVARIRDLVFARVLDGVVIDKSRFGDRQLSELESIEALFVCINGAVRPKRGRADRMPHRVSIDHYHGAKLAVEELVKLGHKRIAMILPSFSGFAKGYMPSLIGGRLQGYRDALIAQDLECDPSLVFEGSVLSRDVVADALDRVLALRPEPTAVFAGDECSAVLVINCLRDRGINVPDDISVLGYGDRLAPFISDKAVTTVHVPWHKMGAIGANMLISMIEGRELEETAIVLKPRVIPGETVGSVVC